MRQVHVSDYLKCTAPIWLDTKVTLNPTTTLSMYRKIPDDLQKTAECKLNEVTSRIENDITQMKEWIAKQPHLNIEIDDQFILTLLRCCKFSLQRTKEKIDTYYTARSIMPEIFSNRDPYLPEIQHLFNSRCIALPLPNLDPDDGSRIIFINYSSSLDPNLVSLRNLDKVNYMILDILIREDDDMIINGLKLITHCKDLSVRFLNELTPLYMKRHVYLVNAFPLRLQAVRVVNCPAPFAFAYSIFKTFTTSKIGQRMMMVSETNVPELCRQSPHLFPKEMGGNNGSIQELSGTWKRKVESYREWFLQEEAKKSDESLRTEPPKTALDLFGADGTFRKLEID
uniref:CRAL-TRIO domain-containing protein n=1 Tax=Photinus pyralis TaxID=7054 RepID=A0A1Y1NKZ5_PHOPY